MANQEHLDILKQGVDIWNLWRAEHADVRPDLSGAGLYDAHLEGVNLFGADLRGANLDFANLSDANLTQANLEKATLIRTNLKKATLIRTNLSTTELSLAYLKRADLTGANLTQANLNQANLEEASLIQADLSWVDFRGTNLEEADLKEAIIGSTVFGNVDLRTVKGLETVTHGNPSIIGIDTLIASQGKIPEIFLRKAGIPPTVVEQIPALVGSLKPIDFYSCFISYSSKDKDFAERLYADLQAKGVRCWLDKEDLKIGEKFRPRIDEAIRRHDKLLIVLSEHSVKSSWVEIEVETAFEKERQYKKLMLFPIRLDEAVIRTKQAWAADIRRQRHIGDFTCWKNHDAYQKSLNRLLRDLKTEARKMGARDAATNDG